MLASRRRAPVNALGPCHTPFRVMPTDLDVLMHVNNGVFLSLMDLARVDLMLRSGLAPKLRARGWYPVVVAETIQFRRSLTLFQPFEIETRVLGWDEKAILVEQAFHRHGEPIAHALVRARFLDRSHGAVAPGDVVALAGTTTVPEPAPEWAARWNAEQVAWRLEKR